MVIALSACGKLDNPGSDDEQIPDSPDRELIAGATLEISAVQGEGWAPAYEGEDMDTFNLLTGGIKVNFSIEGITKLEIESVDALPVAGKTVLVENGGNLAPGPIASASSIITYAAKDGGSLKTGADYVIRTFPADLRGGYRLSIFTSVNGEPKVAHYFGVHQEAEAGKLISPLDLDESELEFDDPDAPLVEEERPELDKKTKELLRAYKNNPSQENYQALYDQMGVRYDKVVARKKAKLRELEREAHHQSLIDEMQGIVDEMVNNREERLWQRFLSLIDSRKDDDPNDAWCVLKGAWEENAYIGYAPVTNAEYKAYKADYSYASGEDRHPVVNICYNDAVDYCNWLSARDSKHAYRLPTEYEWILAAGHMPKDVNMNSNHVESGLTSVDAYAGSVGNCGGIDFWGNCWEWTSTQTEDGKYLIKGGAWDSSRDECRSEYSDASRDGSKGYANVGFRVVRVDASGDEKYAASSCSADGYTIPYRYAQINPKNGVSSIVVLVLHGGPLMGDDNETQLEEAATGILYNYLVEKGVSAVLLAPHCPEKSSHGHRMNWVKLSGVLHEMVLRHRADENTPAFIFGASIGGVGTWNMLSTYPGLFAGAMPCASDPAGCDAANVAKTHVYSVMGTEDTWAPLEQVNLQSFLNEVAAAGGTYRYDIGEGWDHETTCQQSFTTERLDWVFGTSL